MSKISLGALLSCVLLTGSALAGPTVTVTHNTGYYFDPGGEFTLTPNADLTALTGQSGSFQTFCMEKNEYVSMGSTYAAVVNTEALSGGLNNGAPGPGGGDPLDPRTAYLYTRFLNGSLAQLGYDYTPSTGRIFSAKALQDVVWYIENENNTLSGSLENTFYTAAQNAVSSGSWTGLGNIRVLNLYDVGHAGDPEYGDQDQLISVATVPPTVPAPGAIVLLSMGTGLVGWLRRRHTL